MASGNADGVIRINTEVDNTGFFRQTQRLESAVSSMARQVMGIGRQLNSALENGASQKTVENLRYRMHDAAVAVGQLQTRLGQLSNSQVRTGAFEYLTKQVNASEAALQKLYEKQARFITLNSSLGETGAQNYARYTSEIQRLEGETQTLGESLDRLHIRIDEAREMQQDFLSSANYQEVASRVATYESELQSLNNQLSGMLSTQRNLATQMATMSADSDTYRNAEAQVESLTQQINAVVQQMQGYQAELNDARAEQQELLTTGAFHELEQQINSDTASVQELESQLQDSADELQHYTDLRNGITGEFEDAQQWRAMQYDISQAEEELEHYTERRNNLVASGTSRFLGGDRQEIQQMDSLLGQLSSDLDEMGSDLQKATQHVSGFKAAAGVAANALIGLASAALHVVRVGVTAAFLALKNVLVAIGKTALNLAKGAFNTLKSALSAVASRAIQLAESALKTLSSALIAISTSAIKAEKNILKITGTAAISGFKKIASAATMAGKALLTMHKSSSNLSAGLNVGFKNVLRYAFGIRSTFMLVRKLRSAITEGLGSIAKVDSTTNAAISSMITSLNRLKASLSTAFQPIITAISPYVTRLLQLLTQATNKIAEFVAILTGQSYYLKANVTETDYAKSLDTTSKSSNKAAKAAKSNADATKKATNATKKGTKATADANDEMERQLASFDHLNILSDNSKDGSAISGAADAADDLGGAADGLADAAQAVADATSEMGKTTYEKVPVTGFSDFLTKIREAILNQDFDGVGRVIAEKINGMLAKISEWVNWDNIGEKATKVIDSITSVFNGLVDGLDWKLLGETVGNAINSIVYAFDTLLSGIDWINLGKKIGQGLNSLFETVDWSALGGLFATRIGSLLELLYNAIITFDWDKAGADLAEGLNAFILKLEQYFDELDFKKVGESLATGINGFMREFDWKAAGEALGARINDLTFTLAGFVETLEWGDVGYNLATGLNEMIGKIRWSYIGKTLGKGIQGAIDAMTEFVKTFKWGTAGTAFSNAVIALRKEVNLKELGETLGNLVNGAIAYMKNAVRGFTWGNAGGDFADGVNALVGTVNWSDLGKTLANWLNVPFTWLKNAARKFEWGAAGTGFANAVNSLTSNIKWSDIGQSFKESIMGALDMSGKWLQIVQPARLGSGINVALSKIPWKTIATQLWDNAKLAFQKAGSFLDALFSERVYMNSGYLSDKILDDRSLGTKIGDKIRNALSDIPWKEIGATMVENAKKAASNMIDFVAALFGVTDKEIEDAGSNKLKATSKKIVTTINDAIMNIPDSDIEEIGKSIGDALYGVQFLDTEVIGHKLMLLLNDIPWSAIADKAIELLRLAFSGMGNIFKEIFLKDIYGNEISITDLLLGGIAADDTNLGVDKVVKNAFDAVYKALSNEGYISKNKDKATEVLSEIFSAGNVVSGTHGEQSAKSFFEGLKYKYSNASEETKKQLEPYMKAIFSESQLAALESGDMTMESFYTALYSAARDGTGEGKAYIASILNLLYSDTSTTAAMSGKETTDAFFDKGMIPEMEAKQPEMAQTTGNAVDQTLSEAEYRAAAKAAGIPDAIADSWISHSDARQGEVNQATGDMVEQAVGSAENSAETSGESISYKLWSSYIRETLSEQPQTIYAVGDAFDEVWESIDGDGAGSNLAKIYFESFKSKVLDENNRVKPEFVDVVTSMFGSVDGLEAGTVDAKNFMLGLVQGMNDSSGETSSKLVDVINSVLGYVEDSPKGFEQGSPSKRAAKSGKFYMQGIVEGAEGEESSATQKTTSVVSNVLTSVNSTFAGALLLIQKNIPGFTDAVNTLFQSSTTKWNTTFKTGMTNIVNTSATSMTTLQSTILTGLTNLQNHFPTRFATYRSQFSTGWTNIKTDTSNAMNQVNSSVRTSMGTLQSTFSSQLSSINSTVSSRMSSIGNTMRSGMQNAMNQVKNVSWFSIGTYIVEGIYNGINSWWGWLNGTVWNLAISLYNTARNALGIHSPSTVFRDGVGKMIGFGVAEGVEDSEPTILDSVAGVTDAIMDEMNNADTAVDLGIHADNLLAGLDGVLTTFSDRVGSSFTDLITKLDAIAGSVAFRTPAVATGGLLPYSVSGGSANGLNGLSGAQNGIDELASVIIQSTNQAALAIVRAIEKYADSKQGVTPRELVDIVVTEHNRMARAMGESPLLI